MQITKEKKAPLNINKGLLFEYHRANVSSELYNTIGKQLIQEKRFSELTSNHLDQYIRTTIKEGKQLYQ